MSFSVFLRIHRSAVHQGSVSSFSGFQPTAFPVLRWTLLCWSYKWRIFIEPDIKRVFCYGNIFFFWQFLYFCQFFHISAGFLFLFSSEMNLINAILFLTELMSVSVTAFSRSSTRCSLLKESKFSSNSWASPFCYLFSKVIIACSSFSSMKIICKYVHWSFLLPDGILRRPEREIRSTVPVSISSLCATKNSTLLLGNFRETGVIITSRISLEDCDVRMFRLSVGFLFQFPFRDC